jgi:hypothetical protein
MYTLHVLLVCGLASVSEVPTASTIKALGKHREEASEDTEVSLTRPSLIALSRAAYSSP